MAGGIRGGNDPEGMIVVLGSVKDSKLRGKPLA
jgi:hypothetical protein